MFSEGWLDTWKKRHGIKQFVQHGESGDAVAKGCVLGLNQMNSVREILRSYDLEDVYNFDETGYYYRMQPDRRLSTEVLEGVKKDKSRITVGFTCNGTGSHKMKMWVIGTAENPHCFRGLARTAEGLGVFYRYNKTAWMKHEIMMEYLLWFDSCMNGRRVVLLMDNFSAHELAVKQLGEHALRNTTIVWLPANTTSVWQPLDQGIINSWKAHTRRYYVRYLVKEIDKLPGGPVSSDELPKVNILQAIRWAIEAWNFDVKASTIFNCFTKSTVKFFEPSFLSPENLESIKIANPGRILTEFIQFEEEEIENEQPPVPSFRTQSLDIDEDPSANEEMQHLRNEVQTNLEILQQANLIEEGEINLNHFLNPSEEIFDDSIEDLEVRQNYSNEK